MAIDYAQKYSNKIDERFKIGAVTAPAVNNDYDFVGVQTVKVYNIPTVGMNDYEMTGSSRYGTPSELDAPTQELKMTQDRSFTFTIDKRNNADTQGALEAGKALQRQIDEVVIPEIDKYRITKIIANAGKVTTLAVTKANAYDVFTDADVALTDGKVPTGGRIAYVTPAFYKKLKMDSSFIKSGDLSQNMLIKGQVGEVDGIAIIKLPTSYFPANVEFVVTHQIATVAPVKLAEYKVHDNPPGINGQLVEGRVYYDAFVLNNKKNAIYVHKVA